MDTGVNEGLTDPDEVPLPPDEAITQPGDLWILGNHRLLCRDSSNPDLCQLRKLSTVPQEAWFVLQPSDHLEHFASGFDAQGFHGRARVDVLWVERRGWT